MWPLWAPFNRTGWGETRDADRFGKDVPSIKARPHKCRRTLAGATDLIRTEVPVRALRAKHRAPVDGSQRAREAGDRRTHRARRWRAPGGGPSAALAACIACVRWPASRGITF